MPACRPLHVVADWKTTKNFADGCAAHLSGGTFAGGNVALPDGGAFVIEGTSFEGDTTLESNHHCNIGVTGLLCSPTYIFAQVRPALACARARARIWRMGTGTDLGDGHGHNYGHGVAPSMFHLWARRGSEHVPLASRRPVKLLHPLVASPPSPAVTSALGPSTGALGCDEQPLDVLS